MRIVRGMMILVVLTLLMAGYMSSSSTREDDDAIWARVTHIPDGGVVSSAATAIEVAEVALAAVYGKSILEQRPFSADLADGVWRVSGASARPQVGGVAYVRLDRKTGAVLGMLHTQ